MYLFYVYSLEVENLTAELKAMRSRSNSQNRDRETNNRRSSSTSCLSDGQLYRRSMSQSRAYEQRTEHEKNVKLERPKMTRQDTFIFDLVLNDSSKLTMIIMLL